MVGPSPCYINDGDYHGGFSREDIDGLLQMLEANYLGWSSSMAPAIMGAPDQPELGVELTNSFCRTDPDIAKQFARVTFLSDNRKDLADVTTPSLIIQSEEDIIAPLAVLRLIHRHLRAVVHALRERTAEGFRDVLSDHDARGIGGQPNQHFLDCFGAACGGADGNDTVGCTQL